MAAGDRFGRLTELLFGFESSYGAAAPTDLAKLPYYSFDVGAAQGLEEDIVLGVTPSRNIASHAPGLVEHGGSILAPLDLASIGYWLKGLMGAPATSGTTDYTHVFTSGAESLPSIYLQQKLASSEFLGHFGCLVNTFAIGQQRQSGFRRATIGIVGQREVDETVTGDATPTTLALLQVPAAHGTITVDNVAIGTVLVTDVTFNNNLTPDEQLRDDVYVNGYSPGMFAASGTLRARYRRDALWTAGKTLDGVLLQFGWSRTTGSTTRRLDVEMPNARLNKPRLATDGPNGLEVTYDFMAQYDTVGAQAAAKITLKNATASYA